MMKRCRVPAERLVFSIVLLLLSLTICGQELHLSMPDSAGFRIREAMPKKLGLIPRIINVFSDYDTAYVEPSKYNWAFMLKSTATGEHFSLENPSADQRLKFTSKPGVTIGPYFGWRFIFLGYNIDIRDFGNGKKSRDNDFTLSFYTNLFGCDLFYRRTGTDFDLKRARGFGMSREEIKQFEDHSYDGLRIFTTGINLYFVTNYHRFSQPSVFAQSSVQRRSAGSWKFGLSVTQHRIRWDVDNLPAPLNEIGYGIGHSMNYMDYSLTAGYAYNWVFKRNWCLSVGAEPSLGYKRNHREMWADTPSPGGTDEDFFTTNFVNRGNLNVNMNVRAALAWSTGKYFGGLYAVFHNFNYRYHDLLMRNTFFTVNAYIGLNFMRMKCYR